MGTLSRTLLAPVAKIYAREITRRNANFDDGRGVVTLDRPVISIGNLSVGGTGKSPMVAHTIGVLRDDGRNPCIAMRGYGSKKNAHGTSDEADEYAQRFEGLPIVAQPNRTEGLIELFGTEEGEAVDSVVLDDGFQHRRIARQLDIVLIDSTRSPFGDELLPLGRLRESADSLGRAHAVVLTHAESVSSADLNALRSSVLESNRELHIAVAEHAWDGLQIGHRQEPIGLLADKRVTAVCAIGNPEPFVSAVERLSGSLSSMLVLRDHDPYKRGTVGKLVRAAEGCDAIVCTEKDWSKLRHVPTDRWPCPVVRPILRMRLVEGGERLDEMVRSAAKQAPE
ncbi:MAG: tetraacyldisaccharide 4'-kinase [Phycisphaera sp.]|nr:MAG: tetraacyldisaccharide 4'-kinase [Phycisphaera sp.]